MLHTKIRKAVTHTADASAGVVNKAFDAASDVVETAGNVLGDGLAWLGDRIPGIGGIFGWLGDIVAAAADLMGSAIKAIGAALGGILSGTIHLLGSIFTFDRRGILDGVGDILVGIFGGLIVSLGKAAALVQVILSVGRPRRLNDVERRLVALVFQGSIATYNVRVVDKKAGLFSLNDRAFVLGNTIYMKNYTADDRPDVFVHECVHVWQYQHLGACYAAEALASQRWGAGYDWEKEANANKDWERFEREAQGEFIQDIYHLGSTTSEGRGNGAFFAQDDETQRVFSIRRTDWTALANDATRIIRSSTLWRLSMVFG